MGANKCGRSMTALIEADVEEAALDWLEGLGWRVARRQEGSLDAPAGGRVYGTPSTLALLLASRRQAEPGWVRRTEQ